MPELPEVETMARDLAPLVEGATIADAWWDWEPVIRHPDPAAFARQIRGRRIERVGRRAKWLVLDLDDEAVLAIQVKMTGQLFVLPEGTVHDSHVHLRLTLDGGPVAGQGRIEGPRWLLFRDVRKFGRVGIYRRARDGTILGEHDEVLLEVPRGDVEALAPIVREVLEGALKLDVPLDVDVKVGDDWESMTPLERV